MISLLQVMTDLNFSSINDIQKNISLFDDKLRLAKSKLEQSKTDSMLKDLTFLTAGSLEKSSISMKSLRPKGEDSKILDASTRRFMDFMNSQVTMHYK